MKIYFSKKLLKKETFFVFLISLISLKGGLIKAENLFEELQIDSNTKMDNDRSVIPTNPFEIVEKIRRYNALNDATNPSDAIDEALNSFNSLEKEQEI
jgi:hypothetical protein